MLKTFAATLCCLLALASLSHADTPLENSMKRLAKAYKQLTLDLKQPVDASKNDYLALAATMKTEALKGKDLVPKKAAALPTDQQATMVAAYQKSMDDLVSTIDTLSTAIQAGQWDDARKAMDKLHLQENEGHKQFRSKNKVNITQATPAVTSPAAPDTTTPAPAPTTPAQ